jgi:hypothetical protein
MNLNLSHAWKHRQVSTGQFAGLAFVFLWFFIGGIAHFAATDTEARIVPPYIPWPVAAVIVSGVFELLGAFGLLRHRPVPADPGRHTRAHLHAAAAGTVPGAGVGAVAAAADPGRTAVADLLVHVAAHQRASPGPRVDELNYGIVVGRNGNHAAAVCGRHLQGHADGRARRVKWRSFMWPDALAVSPAARTTVPAPANRPASRTPRAGRWPWPQNR